MFLPRSAVLVFFAGMFFCELARANPAAVLTLGTSEDARAVHLGLQIPIEVPWAFLQSPKIRTSLGISIGRWQGRAANRENNRLTDIALLPVVRYFPGGASEGRFFFEGGIGAHLLSRVRIHDERRFGTAFQFGDVLGLGWRFGRKEDFEIGLRYHHISNADIKQPNQGIDFAELRFVAPF